MPSVQPELSLSKVDITLVTPLEKTDHPSFLDPTLFDTICLDAYVPRVYCYRLENTEEAFTQYVNKLKQSLREILVSYYPLAGRWIMTYDATIRRLMCTDEGVPFIEARIEDFNLDDVVDVNDFKGCHLLSGYELLNMNSNSFTSYVETPLPPIFVQVTKFKCGSATLCCTISHMSTDGSGVMRFMQAWSQTALSGETSIIPNFDRSLIPIRASDYLPLPTGKVSYDLGTVGRRFKYSQTISKFLRVRKDVIDAWKKEAAQKNIQLTAVDCMTAHLWRSLASLDSMPQHFNSPETWICTLINGRNRFLDPAVSDNYFGNASFGHHLPIKQLSEIADISWAGSLVHEAVKEVTPSTYKEKVLDLMISRTVYQTFKGRHLILTSWHRFPMYEMDFGCGKPFFAGLNTNNWEFMSLGYCMITPPAPGSEHLACFHLGLPQEIHEALAAHKNFMALFH